MEEYQERVVKEKKELDEKLGQLRKFLTTDKFEGLHEKERVLLKMQEPAMSGYSNILKSRIELFGEPLS